MSSANVNRIALPTPSRASATPLKDAGRRTLTEPSEGPHPRIVHSADRDRDDNRGDQSRTEILYFVAASPQHFHCGPRGYDRNMNRIQKPQPIPHYMAGKVKRGHSYVMHRANAGPHQ